MTRKKMIGWYASLDKETIQDLIRQKREHKILEYVPYNEHPTWKEDIKDKWWSTSYGGAKRNIQSHLPLLQLRERLLSIGGCETVLPEEDEDISDILKYGQTWDNIPVKMMRGKPSQCHKNSATLWYNNKESWMKGFAVVLCTGYAMSDDGFWRQHSWLVHAKPRSNTLIETTDPRVAYFGFGMTYTQASDFEMECW